MMNTQPDKGLPERSIGQTLITEFFHEGLARIVPGLVLSSYAHKPLLKAFDTFHGSSIVFGSSTLVAAWFIGVILENVLFSPFVLLLRFLKIFRWQEGKVHDAAAAPKSSTTSWQWFARCMTKAPRKFCVYGEWIYNWLLPELAPCSNESERIRFLKYNGEKVMYRSMILISVLTAVWTPNLFSVDQWVFSECRWNIWYGVSSAFFFSCCWFFAFITNPQYRPKSKGLAPD